MKYIPNNHINNIINLHWDLCKVCFSLLPENKKPFFPGPKIIIKIHPVIYFECYKKLRYFLLDDEELYDYLSFEAYYNYNFSKFYLDKFPFEYKKHSSLEPMNFNKFLMHEHITTDKFCELLKNAINKIKKGDYILC